MPRKPHLYVPQIPCHVIQRGNNRQACFYVEQDYKFYIECLIDACQRYRVAVHAYVLMTNHVHLLMTPNTTEGISQVMQSLGRRYVQYINMEYQRSGTLWEGRHKASLVDADNCLLTCYRYIELNPVRAEMVVHPADYRWSSYSTNANGTVSDLIKPHPLYLALGINEEIRQNVYRSLFDIYLDSVDVRNIQRAAQFSIPLGNDRFRQQIEEVIGRSIGYAKRGRPPIREEEAIYYN